MGPNKLRLQSLRRTNHWLGGIWWQLRMLLSSERLKIRLPIPTSIFQEAEAGLDVVLMGLVRSICIRRYGRKTDPWTGTLGYQNRRTSVAVAMEDVGLQRAISANSMLCLPMVT